MEEQINSAIKEALETAPERKFVESIEMAFTIKDVDLKNPSNRIEENVRLPRGRGKDVSIAIFASGEMATKAKKAGLVIIDPSKIEDLGGNRQKARKLANKHDFFLSEVPHMATIGRFLGIVLGPRGKMPRPVPPNVDPAAIATGLESTAIIRSRDKVTFHTIVGSRSQSEEDISANAMEMWKRVTSKLERGAGNIRSLYIKTSMGPSVKVEVEAS
ncbi:MAG: 50S ribosomal protein L1 [Euryarchaeota archaeon]|nr:50S ribosomal protein L1 [Euryarchaeota archaeon]|tara:strand:- start:1154 stop:1801 length:648 start_codon:yes stop_codon:yes gene_type:complete